MVVLGIEGDVVVVDGHGGSVEIVLDVELPGGNVVGTNVPGGNEVVGNGGGKEVVGNGGGGKVVGGNGGKKVVVGNGGGGRTIVVLGQGPMPPPGSGQSR
jgi:hypothetical protein